MFRIVARRFPTVLLLTALLHTALHASAATADDEQTAPEPAAPVLEARGAATQPALEIFFLRVKATEVNLRCRADQNSTAVARVPRDTVLRAQADEQGWYRIFPPAGVFSLVSADYIERRGPDEGVVAVRSGQLRVRVGSLLYSLDPLQSEVQRLLPPDYAVTILGEQDGWLRIVPPEGVFLYVHADHVERISAVTAFELGGERRLDPARERPAVRSAQREAAPDAETGQGLLIRLYGSPETRFGCDWKLQDPESGRATAFLRVEAGGPELARHDGRLVSVRGRRLAGGAGDVDLIVVTEVVELRSGAPSGP